MPRNGVLEIRRGGSVRPDTELSLSAIVRWCFDEDKRLKAAYLDAVAWREKVEASGAIARYVETARDQEVSASRAWNWHRWELVPLIHECLAKGERRLRVRLAVLNRSPLDDL